MKSSRIKDLFIVILLVWLIAVISHYVITNDHGQALAKLIKKVITDRH